MRVELMQREADLLRSREGVPVASARLAQLLRLDVCLCLQPLDEVVPLDLVCCDDCCSLVAQGLSTRPELAENRFLVGEAIELMRRQRYAPLIPSLVFGASYGGFGGGINDTITNYNDRVDLDASAYWELRNLGAGDAAARNSAQSLVQQARLRQMATLDLVAREVAEALAQVQARRPQIDLTRQGVAAALESHRLNLVRVQEAQGLPIEGLQSVQALLQARRDYLRIVIDYNAAQFTLQRALGWPIGPLRLSSKP
jgi:outer membrane protein TolC